MHDVFNDLKFGIILSKIYWTSGISLNIQYLVKGHVHAGPNARRLIERPTEHTLVHNDQDNQELQVHLLLMERSLFLVVKEQKL